MLKKALPVALAAGFVLAGCGNNDKDMPDKNETPMEDLDDRARDWTPETEGNGVAPNGTTGPNLDGLEDNDRGMNDDDVINRDRANDDTLEGTGNGEGGTMGQNSVENGNNSAGTGTNGGSPQEDAQKGMSGNK
ncbi:hypothetical protein [Sporosarcina aquimarina]|uniref:Lipoprotein n=1 Tax=Sporosarcina aquimarina TaxID=114975 RepID=A0ABU4FX05_9BACL|nr:hypothetical protein [Sporosarcina aquimarina]MDW0108662.1 hypothetical protein [Sporosarcina aquimarina]